MSYDYSPSQSPLESTPEALQRWIYDELLRISSNVLYQREGWQDVRIAATSTNLGGSKDPAFTKMQDDGAGSQGVFGYSFSQTQEQELYFAVQIPHGRTRNSELRPHVHWSPVDGTSGDVVWGLEYTLANVNGTFGTTTILNATDSTDSTADKHHVVGFTAISGAGVKDSAMLICRVFRDATDAADTYGAGAILLEIDFHVLMGQLGSDLEFPV